jgi:hypothetical protein
MADTYSKLLGLSDSPPQTIEAEKQKPETKQQPQEDKTSLLANQQTSKEASEQENTEAAFPSSEPNATRRYVLSYNKGKNEIRHVPNRRIN